VKLASLLRWQPSQGQIRVRNAAGGFNARLRPDRLVLQNPYLFYASAADKHPPGAPDGDMEQVAAVARLAQADALIRAAAGP
jgi:ABC-type multidrug transport system fused ATPase/permease subunit